MSLHFIRAHIHSRPAIMKTYGFIWRKDELFKVAQIIGKVVTKINTANVVIKDLSVFKGKNVILQEESEGKKLLKWICLCFGAGVLVAVFPLSPTSRPVPGT